MTPVSAVSDDTEGPLKWQCPRGEIDRADFWAPLPVQSTTDMDQLFAVVGVAKTDWEQAVRSGSWQAIAVRLGQTSMVGARDAKSSYDLLQVVDQNGQPGHCGDMIGVAVAASEQEGLEMAIGTASPGGKYFWPLRTRVLNCVVELPSGLSMVHYPGLQS